MVLFFGLGSLLRRFGLTTALLLNPLVMLCSLPALMISPSLLMVQVGASGASGGAVRGSDAHPADLFYRHAAGQPLQTKSVIDTVFYRFGDVSSAWAQTWLTGAGWGLGAGAALGCGGHAAVGRHRCLCGTALRKASPTTVRRGIVERMTGGRTVPHVPI